MHCSLDVEKTRLAAERIALETNAIRQGKGAVVAQI
jgi:hypothetical protein